MLTETFFPYHLFNGLIFIALPVIAVIGGVIVWQIRSFDKTLDKGYEDLLNSFND